MPIAKPLSPRRFVRAISLSTESPQPTVFSARLVNRHRLATATYRTKHEAFVFRSQVVTKQRTIFFQGQVEESEIQKTRLFDRINKMRDRLALPDQRCAPMPFTTRAISIQPNAEGLRLNEGVDVV